MPKSLTASRAASRLGISAKALRFYELAGLIRPERTAAGWRVYYVAHMARAQQIVALRNIGMGLRLIGAVLDGDLDTGLALHEAKLRDEAARISKSVITLRQLQGASLRTALECAASFALPWPWAGERFELPSVSAINFITGPLGSGKTRLAQKLAEVLPGARFVGLDRAAPIDPVLSEGEGPLVIDMIEQGLNAAQQVTLMRRCRARPQPARPLFLMTRSSLILNLDEVRVGEVIIFCPANHSPPMIVAALPGTPGFEAVATCLGTPDARARTAGVLAVRGTAGANPSSSDAERKTV